MQTTKKTSPYVAYSPTHFANLAKSSRTKAMEYVESFNKKWSKVVETTKPEPIKTEEIGENTVMTVEEMKIKLTEAGVSYHHASGLPKLTELMKENNLI